jgi:hypothetical protein
MHSNLHSGAGRAKKTGYQQDLIVEPGKCSAEQAVRLQKARDTKHCQTYGLTWGQFCRQHVGISQAQADQIIRNLEEFGANYFRLSAVVHIAPHWYREIAAYVTDDGIEYGRYIIPLIPVNAARIRQTIAALRRERNTTVEPAPTTGVLVQITDLESRLEDIFDEFDALLQRCLSSHERICLEQLTASLIGKVEHLSKPYTFRSSPTSR